MNPDDITIYVYADWAGLKYPQLMGRLYAYKAKGRKAFGFEYEKDWLKTVNHTLFDPDIHFLSGPQFPVNKENFGVFLDSMPDTWGRTLMRRRALQQARTVGVKYSPLYDTDYLLGVFDECRMGALRFKTTPDGPFLDNNSILPVPAWASVRDLQVAAEKIEKEGEDADVDKWLDILLAPGSSLGGARPKANVRDKNNELWIAKFPSAGDAVDKAAWEYLAFQLARKANVQMAPSKLEKYANHHTFFTKRFDRLFSERIHFASAMTMTGNTEDQLRDNQASYLDLADFIQNRGTDVERNLHQLWRRIVFNIAISNTDDHLRNHGFILTNRGWILSPAFDLNPSTDKNGLSLNIDMDNNALDFELAYSVGEYFRLTVHQMKSILDEVTSSVRDWQNVATQIGIKKSEQEMMESAFNY